MEPEIQRQIEETVIEILENSDMEVTTEFKVRNTASEKLGLDLSNSEYKRFVRSVVQSFLHSKKEAEEEENKKKAEKEIDEDGDLIICRLSSKRKVAIQEFRGKTLVSIREYYDKDGKEMPTSKGISLTSEQWATFSKSVPAIEDAIKKMQSRIN